MALKSMATSFNYYFVDRVSKVHLCFLKLFDFACQSPSGNNNATLNVSVVFNGRNIIATAC